ncbi:hypothetical protein SS50377_26763 [Spironucleus salmonicida]|uniref:Uncharacterized protein n=1 Tax=Spironucleus salmonicida TaxID=348837 RepID=V6LX78_9EUKA|nr:hypothetical protein SS50377_26763 [Spironucleus salmonicida]|eukprot:EST49232.1 Hypothetical protein SS50377_10452 [Spironucleus salmonicida]
MQFNLVKELLDLYPQRRLQEIHKQIIQAELPAKTLNQLNQNIHTVQKDIFYAYEDISRINNNLKTILAQIQLYKDDLHDIDKLHSEIPIYQHPHISIFTLNLSNAYTYLINVTTENHKMQQIFSNLPNEFHTTQLKTMIQNFQNSQTNATKQLKTKYYNLLSNLQDYENTGKNNQKIFKSLSAKIHTLNVLKADNDTSHQKITQLRNTIEHKCRSIEGYQIEQDNLEVSIQTQRRTLTSLATKAQILEQVNNCGYRDDFEWVAPIQETQKPELLIEQRLLKLMQ